VASAGADETAAPAGEVREKAGWSRGDAGEWICLDAESAITEGGASPGRRRR
jgi:hypothetical protein